MNAVTFFIPVADSSPTSWSQSFGFMVLCMRPPVTENLSGQELLDVNSVATNEEAIVVL